MQAAPLALMAVGSLVQGIGAFQSGKYNRKVANINAQQSLADGAAQSTRIRDAARVAAGQQIGAQAESGFEIGTGTALDSLLESATNAELDAMDARRTAMSKAIAYRSQGSMAAREGKNALIGSLFSGAAEVAGGMNDYAAAKSGGS